MAHPKMIEVGTQSEIVLKHYENYETYDRDVKNYEQLQAYLSGKKAEIERSLKNGR
jgi:hypothetical protein